MNIKILITIFILYINTIFCAECPVPKIKIDNNNKKYLVETANRLKLCCNEDKDCENLKKCDKNDVSGKIYNRYFGTGMCYSVEGSLCSENDKCPGNSFCIDGKCQSNKYKPNGESCNSGLECQSTYCNNGICESTEGNCRTDNICKSNEWCCNTWSSPNTYICTTQEDKSIVNQCYK